MNDFEIRFSILTEIFTTIDKLSPGTFQMMTERSQSKLRIGSVAGTHCALNIESICDMLSFSELVIFQVD